MMDGVPHAVSFSDFDAKTDQAPVRDLILQGLGDHWGTIEAWRNPDLDDIATSYSAGRTLVARDDEGVVATGTLISIDGTTAEIVRMSVRNTTRRGGVGRLVVAELLATARGWGTQRVVLETTSAWEGVVAFYLRCGFRITHFEDSEYGQQTWFEFMVGSGEQ